MGEIVYLANDFHIFFLDFTYSLISFLLYIINKMK